MPRAMSDTATVLAFDFFPFFPIIKAEPYQDEAQAQAEEASDNVAEGLHGAPQVDGHP